VVQAVSGVAQNIERYFSENVVYSAVNHAWRSSWAPIVVQAQRDLIQLGIDRRHGESSGICLATGAQSQGTHAGH